jgi:hypothetical protein
MQKILPELQSERRLPASRYAGFANRYSGAGLSMDAPERVLAERQEAGWYREAYALVPDGMRVFF